MTNHDSEMIQYSKRLDGMLVSESERLWFRQEKPDVIRHEMFGSHYVLHNPKAGTHASSSVCEGGKMPWAGIQTHPWTDWVGEHWAKRDEWTPALPHAPAAILQISGDYPVLPLQCTELESLQL